MNEKIEKAQKKLDWAIMDINGTIKCKVDNYKNATYQILCYGNGKDLTDGAVIVVPEEWIEDTHPEEKYIRKELKSLLRHLKRKQQEGVI
jgi:hypothetical protein